MIKSSRSLDTARDKRGLLCIIILLILLSFLYASPKMAIVVDDVGYSLIDCQKLLEINTPLTIAVIPGMAYSQKCAKLVKEHDQQLLIHFPWYYLGKNYQKKYPIHLDKNMSKEQMQKMVSLAIISVPGSDGINNHMGSYLSRQDLEMQRFMKVISKYKDHKYFLDSHTSNSSKAYWYAKNYGIKTAKNNVFLDGVQKADYIEKQFVLAIREARKYGTAIAICHGNRKVTLRVLKNLINKYNEHVDYVYLPEIIEMRDSKDAY